MTSIALLEKPMRSALWCVKRQGFPTNCIEREDGWRGFRIEGVLDFSLVGILAEISRILAEQHIGIFAISTFNTDYILTKSKDFQKALEVLICAGYKVMEP